MKYDFIAFIQERVVIVKNLNIRSAKEVVLRCQVDVTEAQGD